jgi:3-methyl-2-oxobutanoate hydroxymethyltransferase
MGLSERPPSFAKKYADVAEAIRNAVRQYVEDVKTGKFPSKEHYRD